MRVVLRGCRVGRRMRRLKVGFGKRGHCGCRHRRQGVSAGRTSSALRDGRGKSCPSALAHRHKSGKKRILPPWWQGVGDGDPRRSVPGRRSTHLTPFNVSRRAGTHSSRIRLPNRTFLGFSAPHCRTWKMWIYKQALLEAGIERTTVARLFFIHLGSPRVHLAGVTAHPDGGWVAQQARNVTLSFAEQAEKPAVLVRDNDRKFGPGFDAVFAAERVRGTRITPASPNLNAYAERWCRAPSRSAWTGSSFSEKRACDRSITAAAYRKRSPRAPRSPRW
jgi:hypothetical protein